MKRTVERKLRWKRAAGVAVSLLALLTLAFVTSAKAETVQAWVPLSPANEVPPVTGIAASGAFQITVNVTRDSSGAITGGSVRFLGSVSFPGSVTVTGLHIHEGNATVSAGVVINTGLGGSNTMTFASGAGIIDLTAPPVTDTALLARLLKNPAGFYVNLHTSANPGGVIRGQLIRFEERQAQTVTMNTAAEIPPVTNGLSGTAVATITALPTRDDKGVVTGGTVIFSMAYDLPAGSVLTGWHIHEGAADISGPVVINTGLSGSNSVTTATGKGSLSIAVPISSTVNASALAPFQRLLANPAGFYVNAHTSANPGGIIRSQLSSLAAPTIIQTSDTYFLETGNTDATIKLILTAPTFDLGTTIIVNGQTLLPSADINTGVISVTIPAALRANAGILFVQARGSQGLMSSPIQIVVGAAANVNTVAATTVDGAKYGAGAAPNSIAALFGTKLASTTVSAPATGALPTALDGTSVYVNGVAARLFFVSTGQINYLVPAGTIAGPAQVVVAAKDGTVSRGTVTITQSTPSLFTRTANGLGAPAAVASPDGQNFTINMANADGTAVPIDAGNFVMLFGTGIRYASTAMTMSIGGTAVTPTFFGAQGQFEGEDQINVQIPQSLAGKGDADLTFTVDGKTSNTVKLKIK